MPGHSSKTVVTQIRLTNEMDAAISLAAQRAGIAKNDIIKLCLSAGLKWLEAKDYDVSQELGKEALTIIDQLKAIIDSMAKRQDTGSIREMPPRAARGAEDSPARPKKKP